MYENMTKSKHVAMIAVHARMITLGFICLRLIKGFPEETLVYFFIIFTVT